MKYEILDNKMLCQNNGNYISYKAGKLYKQDSFKKSPICLTKLPNNKVKGLLTLVRHAERLLRMEPRVAVEVGKENIVMSYRGAVYNVNTNDGSIKLEHRFRNGMNNPLSFCTTTEQKQRILYGEYWINAFREKVCIFERDKDGCWREIFAFNAGEVTHIHRIVFDKFRNCFWILTGDNDNESAIWQADYNFKEVKAVFKGEQKYRSCFLVPEENGLLYATDTPLEDNSIYFIPIETENKILPPIKIYDMPGPCIYGKVIDENLFAFATSVEPDSSLPKWRYYFTRKTGKGVKTRKSYIVLGNSKDGFNECFEAEKDMMNMSLFQFGNFQFAETNDKNKIFCAGQALKKVDGKTLIIEI